MSGSKSRGVLLTGLALALALSAALPPAGEAGEEYDPAENYPEVVEQLERASDVFAAFIIAYEADRLWFKENKGVDLTPGEFVRRHDRVLITRLADERFEIQMGPEPMEGGEGRPVRVVNPGRRYIVDAKSLQLIEAFFDR